MPKERSSRRVKQQAKRANERVTCEECLEEFSAMGFHNHVGSKACDENIITRPIRLEVAERRVELLKSKRRVKKTFINACERRDMLGFIGSEQALTKYIEPQNGQPCKVVEEWWVHQWVGELYSSFSMLRATPNPAYDVLLELHHLDPDQRELAISLYILRYAEL